MTIGKENLLENLDRVFEKAHPNWDFLKSAAQKFINESDDNQKCQYTEEELEKFSEYPSSLETLGDILNCIGIKCKRVSLNGRVLTVINVIN